MKVSTSIKKEDFELWYEIFKCSGGRLVSNPIDWSDSVRVEYVFEDMDKANAFHYSFWTLTTPIIETKRSKLEKIKRRVKRWFK